MQRSLRSVLSTARRSTTALPLRRPRNATALRLAPLSTRSNLPISNAGSMNTKKLSLALLSGLVLTGAWYYRDTLLGTSETGFPIAGESSSTPSTTITIAKPGATKGPRKVVAVDDESVYTGTLSAGPGGRVSKEVENNNGEKVVEMLTPEQTTSKLRRNEESYFVGRGKGVWRYDVVQIPSNDPIEDDHAEKIIEVPPTILPVEEGQDTGPSDWMFWGVFDGHRFVSSFLMVSTHCLPSNCLGMTKLFFPTVVGLLLQNSVKFSSRLLLARSAIHTKQPSQTQPPRHHHPNQLTMPSRRGFFN